MNTPHPKVRRQLCTSKNIPSPIKGNKTPPKNKNKDNKICHSYPRVVNYGHTIQGKVCELWSHHFKFFRCIHRIHNTQNINQQNIQTITKHQGCHRKFKTNFPDFSLTIHENSLTFLKALKVNSTSKLNSVP